MSCINLKSSGDYITEAGGIKPIGNRKGTAYSVQLSTANK